MNAIPPRVHVPRPMQVRFFRERDLAVLESAVNRWLAERRDREIVEVRQSATSAPGRHGGAEVELVVSVWYIDG